MTIAPSPDPWRSVLNYWADPDDEPAIDAFAVLGYEPNCLPRLKARERGEVIAPCGQCPQEQFHAATEDDVLYGGAAGGGKSLALLMEGLRACVRYPGMWVAGYRRTYDELEESLLKELEKLSFAEKLGARWNAGKHELTFPRRRGRTSKMRFRYAETKDDAIRRQGGDYQLLLVDERTLMAPGVVAVLAERLRSADAEVPVIGLRSSANPGGPSHGEAKTDYIEATNHGAKVVTDGAGRTIRFIPAKLSDNPHLDRDAGYHRTLDAIKDPARRKAMKDGDWDVFAGQYFAQWRLSRHVVKPFPVPVEWEREAGIDYGFAAPWAVAFMAFDGDGRAWMYNELYDTGVGATDQAARILAVEEATGEVRARHADPSMWAKVGENNTIAETYAEAGCTIRKAVNDRVNGWARVQHYLAEMPACLIHQDMGWLTCPRLHVFENCANLIRTLPNAPRDKNKPEDIDTTCEDHCLVAGTMVMTDTGERAIETIKVGERVLTRAGYRRVLAAGMTNVWAPVDEVFLSSGATIVGTGSHPVWTEKGGWVPLDALRYGDILTTCPESIESCSTESSSGATPTPRTPAIGSTSHRAPTIAGRVSGGFTRRFGRRRTGRFPTATTSTTTTATTSTTPSGTSSASPKMHTSPSTQPSVKASGRSGSRRPGLRPWRKLLSGTGLKRVEPGTANTAGWPTPSGRPSVAPASSAERSIRRPLSTVASGSARTTARAHGAGRPASTTRSERVLAVAKASRSIATPAPDAAPVYVLGRYAAGHSPVFNLTVEDQPEFFANGVLVHNCLDAGRYLLMGRGVPFEPVAPLELPQSNAWDMGDSAIDYGEGWDPGGGGYADYGR